MGYYTQYRLYVVNRNHNQFAAFHEKVIEGEMETHNGYRYDHFYHGDHDSCKWYEHDQDMADLSREYPDLIFLLEGKGEESGDVWKKYYVNGTEQICRAKLVYEPFDVMKLKPVTPRNRQ